MNYGKTLAIAGIFLSIGASIGYFAVKDYRRAVYYLLCAGIAAVVTF